MNSKPSIKLKVLVDPSHVSFDVSNYQITITGLMLLGFPTDQWDFPVPRPGHACEAY